MANIRRQWKTVLTAALVCLLGYLFMTLAMGWDPPKKTGYDTGVVHGTVQIGK